MKNMRNTAKICAFAGTSAYPSLRKDSNPDTQNTFFYNCVKHSLKNHEHYQLQPRSGYLVVHSLNFIFFLVHFPLCGEHPYFLTFSSQLFKLSIWTMHRVTTTGWHVIVFFLAGCTIERLCGLCVGRILINFLFWQPESYTMSTTVSP